MVLVGFRGIVLKTRVANIALVLVSVIGALGICELAVRFIAPQNLNGSWFIRAPTGPYMLNKSEGTAQHQFGPRTVRYSFAAPHLRAPKPRGQRKILVLGDSFTFGILLSAEDTYVGRLQALADAEFGVGTLAFLNAGVGGSGTAEHVAYYEDFGLDTGADTVVVFLNTDDIGRSLRSPVYRFDPIFHSLTRSPSESGVSLRTLLNSLPFYNAVLQRSHLMQLVRRAVLEGYVPGAGIARVPVPTSPDGDAMAARELGAALFARLARLTKQRGHRLIVITTGWHRFVRGSPNEPTAAFMAIAPKMFAVIGVPFFDIASRIYERANGNLDEVSIPHDGHPNERGAKLIAEAAWEVLGKQLR